MPPPPQTLLPVQVLVQMMAWLQLFIAGPHALPAQAVVLSGVQPHCLESPAPLQVLGDWQVSGQAMVWLQLLVAVPQAWPEHATATSSGMHWHVVTADPAQDSLPAHEEQR